MPSNSANTKDNEGTQSLDKELQNPTVELSSSTGVISEVSTARCSYRDFSQVLGEKNAVASVAMSQTTTAKEPTFPIKLHMILSNPEFQDIISWLPHGRSWRILQQKAFEERVIPLYFRHGRYSSFARQVNGWGFRRVTHGSDYNSYYHEMFLRGIPYLCEKMRRLTNKDTAARKKLEDEPAPNFYAFSRSHPLPENAPIPPPTIPVSLAPPGITGGSFVDMEAALTERRRADFLDRLNLLGSTNGLGISNTMGNMNNGLGDYLLEAAGIQVRQPDLMGAGGLGASLYGRTPAQFSALESGMNTASQSTNPALQQLQLQQQIQQQILQNRSDNSDLAQILTTNGGGNYGIRGLMRNSGMGSNRFGI